MTYVKNISNWPDPRGQMMDMSHNYYLSDKGHFPAGKTRKQQKHTNIQIMDMVYGFDHIRVIFLEKLKTAK